MPTRSPLCMPCCLMMLPALMLTSGHALGQDDPPQETTLAALSDEVRVRLRATAGVWIPALSGDVRFGAPGSAGDLSVDGFLDLEDNEPTFAGDVALFIDERWLVRLSAFDFATEATTVASAPFRVNGAMFAGGTALASDLGLTSVAADVGYDFFGNIFERIDPDANADGHHIDVRAHLLGGVRGLSVDHRLAIGGGPTVRFDEWGATLNGGVRLGVSIGPDFAGRHRWDVDVTVTYGMGGSSDADLTILDLVLGIHYTVVDHFALVLGYRQFDFDFDAEDASQPYLYDGRLAGVFFGGEVKF